MSEEIKTEVKAEVKKEKKPMKKWLRNLLIVLAVIVFAGLAVFFVKLYFDHENSKPKFEFPPIEPRPSVSALPETKEDAYQYVSDLFDRAMSANDVELSWSTGVDLSGEMKTPFKKEDQDIVLFIRDRAQGQIGSLYPSVSGVIASQAEEKPELFFGLDSIVDFSSEQGHTNEDGTKWDEDYYYIYFNIDPSVLDIDEIKNGKVKAGIEETLASAMKISELDLKPDAIAVSFKVDRVTDQLLSVDIRREYTVTSTVELQGEYATLAESGTADIEFPYKANENITFSHYGVRFLEQQIVAVDDDMQSLPVKVNIKSDATPEEYKLSYEISAPDVLDVDSDVVMRVHKAYIEDKPIEVKMILEFNGHTYSDSILVYVTEKEVPTNE